MRWPIKATLSFKFRFSSSNAIAFNAPSYLWLDSSDGYPPFTDKNAFSELIPSAIPDINTSQSLASSTENLIEDEPQLITKTTGNSFISFLILSYGLKQFVYDVQD